MDASRPRVAGGRPCRLGSLAYARHHFCLPLRRARRGQVLHCGCALLGSPGQVLDCGSARLTLAHVGHAARRHAPPALEQQKSPAHVFFVNRAEDKSSTAVVRGLRSRTGKIVRSGFAFRRYFFLSIWMV